MSKGHGAVNIHALINKYGVASTVSNFQKITSAGNYFFPAEVQHNQADSLSFIGMFGEDKNSI